jgi:hypothetical protein
LASKRATALTTFDVTKSIIPCRHLR